MDPAIWKFLENVTVQRNDELSALYAKAVANIVHVTLQDGRILTKRVDYPLGNARNPVSDKQLEGKFNALVVPALGEDGAQKILAAGWKLDETKSPIELMKLARMPV
jgi:2-methylcitrate dehydratase